MKTVKLKVLQDYDFPCKHEDGKETIEKWKKGQIVEVSEKHHEGLIKGGIAIVLDIKKEPLPPDKKTGYTPKDILDKYQPMIIRKNKVYLNKKGDAEVNSHEKEKYNQESYREDIILQVAPKDAIVLEFEDTPEQNKRFIEETEESCRVQGLQSCITDHKGKSPYLRIYNIKGIPTNYDNKLAKTLLINELLPSGAKKYLDKTNLGWTLSPVIGHPHWKPKYKGEIHKIIRGTHPLDQVNEYPKELLKKIKNSKKVIKTNATETLKNNPWVNDFLVNYCTTHLLPGGHRHHVIEKNLIAMIHHREDKETIIEKYLAAQERGDTDTTNSWQVAVANGKYTQVSVLELKRYIDENNIDYIIKKTETETEEPETIKLTEDHITILKDPKLLLNIINLTHELGVVGEESTILTLINKINLRLLPGHKPTSSNMVVSDVSGSGKDAITGAVTKIMVPEDKLKHRTRFSDKALEYMMVGKDEKETLDGTVFYLEDPEDEMIKSQAFRVLSSGQNEATVVKDQETLELKIKGKPVIIVTSMNTTIDLEGERRWDAVNTDTSEILTKLVIKEKLKRSQEGHIPKPKPLLAQALQGLKPGEVIIPYADFLYQYFTEKTPSLIMRTQIDKFLDYIKSSAVLHQYQREKDDKGRIIANIFDYLYSKYIFSVLGDAEGGMLNSIERKLVDILKIKGEMTIPELASVKGFPRSVDWIYKHQDDLKARHIIGEQHEWNEKANKNVTKIFCDIGASGLLLPKGSVLLGFITQFQNLQQEGLIGIIGFINNLKELNKKRNELGLLPIRFDDLDDFQKNLDESLTNAIKPIKPEYLSVDGIILPNNTEENLSVGQEEKEPTYTHKDVKNYITDVENKVGKGVTLELLCDKFPDNLIMDLMRDFLVPYVDNSGFKKYTWKGVGAE